MSGIKLTAFLKLFLFCEMVFEFALQQCLVSSDICRLAARNLADYS